MFSKIRKVNFRHSLLKFCVLLTGDLHLKSTGSNGHHYLSKEFPCGPPPASFNLNMRTKEIHTQFYIFNQCDIFPLPCLYLAIYFQTKLPERRAEREPSFFQTTVACKYRTLSEPSTLSVKCVSTFAYPLQRQTTRVIIIIPHIIPAYISPLEISSSGTDFSFSRHKNAVPAVGTTVT